MDTSSNNRVEGH